MEYHAHDTVAGVLVLAADHQLDSYGCDELMDKLQQAINAGVSAVVVDCSRLGYVSTLSVCKLIRLHKRLAEHGGELRLADVQPPLRRVLHLTRLDQVWRLFPAVDNAAAAPLRPAAPSQAPR